MVYNSTTSAYAAQSNGIIALLSKIDESSLDFTMELYHKQE